MDLKSNWDMTSLNQSVFMSTLLSISIVDWGHVSIWTPQKALYLEHVYKILTHNLTKLEKILNKNLDIQ